MSTTTRDTEKLKMGAELASLPCKSHYSRSKRDFFLQGLVEVFKGRVGVSTMHAHSAKQEHGQYAVFAEHKKKKKKIEQSPSGPNPLRVNHGSNSTWV